MRTIYRVKFLLLALLTSCSLISGGYLFGTTKELTNSYMYNSTWAVISTVEGFVNIATQRDSKLTLKYGTCLPQTLSYALTCPAPSVVTVIAPKGFSATLNTKEGGIIAGAMIVNP